ncbi:MAG: hypothetical protein NVS3B2_02940 [Ramlibacter sp.]
MVLSVLRKAGIPSENLSCASWFRFTHSDVKPMRFVITLADDPITNAAPTWPGQPVTASWLLPDLLESGRTAPVSFLEVQQTLYSLRRRIELLISLPMTKYGSAADLRSDVRDLAYIP